MIKHEEVVKAFERILEEMQNCFQCDEYNEDVNEDISVVKQYITEQEKKEELLKLYRKYSKGLSSGRLNLQQLLDLFDKIKELEEEMK